MPIIETTITDFGGGMTNLIRSSDNSKSRVITHFDALSDPNRLVPHLSHTNDSFATGSASVNKLSNFLTYGATNSATAQYAMGVNSGTNNIRIYKRDSLPSAQFTGQSSSTKAFSEKVFIEYKGNIYFGIDNVNAAFTSITHIAQYSVSGNSYDITFKALTATDVIRALVHSKNDILFILYYTTAGTFVAKYDNATWTNIALTLPTNELPVDMCELGDLLVIATKPLSLGGKSHVYLWDMNATSWNEKIDWGSEDIQLIEQADGELIGMSITGATSIVVNPKIIFKRRIGPGKAKQFQELQTSNISIFVGNNKQYMNNRIYFQMLCEINSVVYAGIWTIGKNKLDQFVVSLDRLWDSTTTFTASDTPLAFQLLGDYMTIAYTVATTYTIKRTNDSSTHNDTSIYETIIFGNGISIGGQIIRDPSQKKDLVGVTIMTEPIQSAQTYTLKYKKDSDASFTTLLTHTTTNAMSTSVVSMQTSPNVFPKDYKEIQFQITHSATGVILAKNIAALTGLSFREEITDKRPY